MLIAGFSVSQPLTPPLGIRGMHQRLALHYFVARTEPLLPELAAESESRVRSLVSADFSDILGPVCVGGHKERRFE